VDVFSPVTVFTSVNGVATTCAGLTDPLLTAATLNNGAAAFYRYFNWYIQF
jgi:hypothetical protein